MWNIEKDGEYSVKIAYHLLRDLRCVSKPGPSSRVNKKLWKNLWKVPVNARIKNFNWRLAKDILPARVNLSQKGISLDVSYPFCHLYLENSLHIFMQCDFYKRVLFSSPLGFRIPYGCDIVDWLRECIANKECMVCQVVMVALWKIWQMRNNVIFKDATPDPCFVAQEIWDAIEEKWCAWKRSKSGSFYWKLSANWEFLDCAI